MPKGLRNVEFSFGDSTLTHYGGLVLFQQFCRKLDLKRQFQRRISWQSVTRGYQGAELLLCLIYTMVSGLKRISDTRILAYNRSFQNLLGLQRFPAETTLRDFLKNITPHELAGIRKIHERLRARLRDVPCERTSFIMDVDSTVLPLYGWTIQGARVGYNPRKHCRPSYHPMVGFDGRTQDTIHGLLRPGDTQPISAACYFTRRCLSQLPTYANRKRVTVRLRADAGFYADQFLKFLDEKNVGYVVVAKLTKPLRSRAMSLRYRTFRQRGRWQVAQTRYPAETGPQARRFILVRRPKPEQKEVAQQLSLWEFEDFFYHAFVTNLSLRPAAVYRFYTARANAELDLRELKEALPLGKIPTTRFTANAAHFELILLTYDLVNWFRRLCLPGSWQKARLTTIRRELFMLPARLVNDGHRNVLKLPREYPHRKRFLTVADRIAKFSLESMSRTCRKSRERLRREGRK